MFERFMPWKKKPVIDAPVSTVKVEGPGYGPYGPSDKDSRIEGII